MKNPLEWKPIHKITFISFTLSDVFSNYPTSQPQKDQSVTCPPSDNQADIYCMR